MGIRTKATRSASPRRSSAAMTVRSAKNDRAGRKPHAERLTRVQAGRPHLERPAAATKTSPANEAKTPNNAISSYGKAFRFLATLSDFERLRIVRYTPQNFDLDRMRLLLKKLGNPQDQFRTVHVAGTKGKGSTCAMIASMLQANGYKTGLYTSPHLVDIRERICLDGEMIPQAEFARLVRQIEPIVAKMRPTPSYFDVLTAIAFKYYADHKAEIVVVETGLGGRLDSTNVIKPEVTAIPASAKTTWPNWGQRWPASPKRKPESSRPAYRRSASSQDPGSRSGPEAHGRSGRRPAGDHRQGD